MSIIKVSIIIPIYNVEKYLGQCLDSIINQSLKEIEIICVNDGSTDNSPQILEEYAQKDQRIKIINKENNGPGASRKVGLNYATGEFIAFVDSDDWVKLDTYEKLYKNGVSNNSDLVIFNAIRYDENNDKYLYMGGFDIANYLNDNNDNKIDFKHFIFNYKDIKPYILNRSFSAWAKLYKSEFLNNYNDFYFPEDIFYEDVPFHVQVLLRAKRISFFTERLYIYRVSSVNSMINSSSRSRKVFDIFIIVDEVKQFLIENNKLDEFKSEFNLFIIRQLTQWLDKCGDSYKQEFFEETKQRFKYINLKNDDFSQLNLKYKNIIASDSYKELKLLEEIQLLKSTYSNQIKKLTKNYEDKINTQKQTSEQKLINQKQAYEEKINTQKQSNEQKLNYQKQVYEERIEFKEQLIEKMHSSNSWKLTFPLRKLGKLFKKIDS
jgi:glycosyltransferase involved in cell wall biosynthesis